MERPKNIKSFKATLPVRLVIIFHLVGIVGLSITETKPLFLTLVPYHLLLMMGILFFTHIRFGQRFVLFFLLIFTAGFAAEWAGVHTGQLFGNYVYGPTLGFGVDGIPLIMGVNWFLLVYSVGVTLQYIGIKHLALRVLLGALLLVLLDFVIEPAAIKFNYWHWAVGVAPVNNYICWFVLGAILVLIFELFKFKKQSIVGVVLLISQFIFFIALLSEPVVVPKTEPIKIVKPR
ncbi:MAG: carotenoid biosynthesis protein [Bacteroidota bacterium]